MQLATTNATATTMAAHTTHPAVADLGLALLRLHLTQLLRSGVFTPAERETAATNIHATADTSKLALWKKNVARVKAAREAAAGAPAAASEEIESEAAAQNLTVEQLADLSSHPTPTVNPHLARAYGNAVAERERRGSTSDYAGELAQKTQEEAFFTETGLAYADLARL